MIFTVLQAESTRSSATHPTTENTPQTVGGVYKKVIEATERPMPRNVEDLLRQRIGNQNGGPLLINATIVIGKMNSSTTISLAEPKNGKPTITERFNADNGFVDYLRNLIADKLNKRK